MTSDLKMLLSCATEVTINLLLSYHTSCLSLQFEWILAKSWGVVFIDPFIVTLLDSTGGQVASRRFTDSRTFYIWEDINVRARHIRIDSLEREGLCVCVCVCV